MAYDPLTGRYTPDPAPVMTPFGQATSAPKAPTAAPAAPAAPTTRVAANEARKAAGPPSEAPAGYTWKWVGTEYKLYKNPTPSPTSGASGDSGSSSGSGGTGNATQDLLLAQQKKAEEEAKLRDRQSAYDILYNEFNRYGLGSLVEDVKYLLQSNVSPSQFSIELQNTDAYKKRFAANQDRIKAGLRVLTPAEYIGLEDQYQNIMRNYGLPANYYSKDSMGTQEGFKKLLANDVSASELEDRIATAQQRVMNANPEVLAAIKNFYGDSITNGDILAYALNPEKGLADIKKKVAAAEIQGAANVFGLNKITPESTPDQIKAMEARANALAGYGVDKAAATQGYATVAQLTPIASQLADIYKQTPYTQQTAEAEVFNTSGAAEATAQRKKLKDLETAQFSGSSGVGALGRDKAVYGATQGQAGLY